MNYLVAPNRAKPAALAFAVRSAQTVRESGHRPLCTADVSALLPGLEVWQGEQIDRVICLGGDGTILRLFHDACLADIPVWCVNFGHLGYLTDCEPECALSALDKILKDDFRLEKRTLLSGELIRRDGTKERSLGVNEACAHRGGLSRALRLMLRINGVLVRDFQADGLITATATGSTAYNYSAGGPLLTPEAEGLVLTPICARPADRVPLVTGGSERITVEIHMPPENPPGAAACLEIDGCLRYDLLEGDRVEIGRSGRQLSMIRTGVDGFYDRLRERLTRP